MGHRARVEHVELPREIVQRIFGVMPVKDRVRAQAVCTSWRAYLNHRTWPIGELELDGSTAQGLELAQWVCHTQPMLQSLWLQHYETPQLLPAMLSVSRTGLTKLYLAAKDETIHDALPSLCLFPNLAELDLELDDEYGNDDELNLLDLPSLPALQRFGCINWGLVEVIGPIALPQLTYMPLYCSVVIEVDATLPSLQQLEIFAAGTCLLSGKRLRLPRLTALSLQHVLTDVQVDWLALPELASLKFEHYSDLRISTAGLSALSRLTELHVTYGDHELTQDPADLLLQAAPPTVCSLGGYGKWEWSQPLPLNCTQQLTSLTCSSVAIIPILAPLRQLQQLEFLQPAAYNLLPEHLDVLKCLSRLRRLRFGKKPASRPSTDDIYRGCCGKFCKGLSRQTVLSSCSCYGKQHSLVKANTTGC